MSAKPESAGGAFYVSRSRALAFAPLALVDQLPPCHGGALERDAGDRVAAHSILRRSLPFGWPTIPRRP